MIRTLGDGVRARGLDLRGLDVSADLDDEITAVYGDRAPRVDGTTALNGTAALRRSAPPIDGAGTYSLRPISLGDSVPRQRPRRATR